MTSPPEPRRLPPWIKVRLPAGGTYQRVSKLLEEYNLRTVCHNALCPNRGECFSKGTATFLILGNHCTRHCRYCHIDARTPDPPDPQEAANIATVSCLLGLQHVVITSVTRDDLPDGGATQFAAVTTALQAALPTAGVELLIPDFGGSLPALSTVLSARPQVLNHNLETVAELFPLLRPEGDYTRSLELLARVKKLAPQIALKSGLMLGFGETPQALTRTLQDLFDQGVEILTLGQYLQPSPAHFPVHKFYTPAEFTALAKQARELGFRNVSAAPLVRSSYHARELYHDRPSPTP